MAFDDQAKRDFKIVGTRVARPDGIDKVTGKAAYGADITAPGMLHARILRSPHAHARIKSINTTAALALPGVKAIVTSEILRRLRIAIMPTLPKTVWPTTRFCMTGMRWQRLLQPVNPSLNKPSA